MDEARELRLSLQESMCFLGAIACGLEEALGDPANTVTHLAGEKLGRQLSEGHCNGDLLKALTEVQEILKANGCLWQFECFKPKNQESVVQQTEDGQEVQLVFRDCMIRQALFRFGHHQKGSLCNMMSGFFASAIQTIMGREASMEIVHAGENACIKKLVVRSGKDHGAAPNLSQDKHREEVLQHG